MIFLYRDSYIFKQLRMKVQTKLKIETGKTIIHAKEYHEGQERKFDADEDILKENVCLDYGFCDPISFKTRNAFSRDKQLSKKPPRETFPLKYQPASQRKCRKLKIFTAQKKSVNCKPYLQSSPSKKQNSSLSLNSSNQKETEMEYPIKIITLGKNVSKRKKIFRRENNHKLFQESYQRDET